jgi:chemotaxis protein MotB
VSKRAIRIATENGDNGPAWLTTFNDLVTLLMVFFVPVFTMGSVDTQKLKEFQYALQSGLGVLGQGSQVAIEVKDSRPVPDQADLLTQTEGDGQPVDEQQEAIPMDEVLKAYTAEPGINVRYSNQGAHITFEDHLLFNFGKADINPQRFSAVGYGETRPLVPNESPASRTRNRQVEIVLETEG